MPLIGCRQTLEDSKGRMLTSLFLNLFTWRLADTNLGKMQIDGYLNRENYSLDYHRYQPKRSGESNFSISVYLIESCNKSSHINIKIWPLILYWH